jgi:hypothetical protein
VITLMRQEHMTGRYFRFSLLISALTACCVLSAGCQEVDTLKRELLRKVEGKLLKKTNPFVPKDAITLRNCSLYQTANPNSEVIKKLPAETPVHLIDRIGEFYRIRTRDGREGYLEQKAVGGQEIIQRTLELRRSIEGMPPQAEGVTKTKANFRLDAGKEKPVVEVLPPGKKFEVYERVVTVRRNAANEKTATRGRPESSAPSLEDEAPTDDASENVKKDVWYKVKIEDGRVGFLYTHNMQLTPPEDIAGAVPFMRMIAWRSINVTDDPDRGVKNNYIVACAPIGKDPGCDFTRLYFMNWSSALKRRNIVWQTRINGVLPITNYHFEGKPGFSVRLLHPTKKDRLIVASFVFAKGNIRKVSEEEMPNNAVVH